MRQFSTFFLDEQLFGVEILIVREINQLMDITPVQQAPANVRGLVNLRGQIVTIFDLGICLGLAAREISGRSHNIILKTDSELVAVRQHSGREDFETAQDPVGLLVDAISDVVEVEAHEIESPPANLGEVDGRFLAGVVKLDNALLVLLDAKEILHDGDD